MDRSDHGNLAILEGVINIRKHPKNPESKDPLYQSVTLGMETVVGIMNSGDFGFRPDERDYPLLYPSKKDNNKAP